MKKQPAHNASQPAYNDTLSLEKMVVVLESIKHQGNLRVRKNGAVFRDSFQSSVLV